MALTNAERQQKLRDNRKGSGLVEVRVRVKPAHAGQIKQLADKLNRG